MQMALLLKGEQDNKTNEEAEAEKKAKPKKKSKISEDISVELLINDILDPTADDLTSSKKKYSRVWVVSLCRRIDGPRMLTAIRAFVGCRI